jgi:hypothetical protein
MAEFQKWVIDESRLTGITIFKARDLIVECFHFAQKDKFKALRVKAGIPSTDEDISNSIKVMVRLAFTEVGGDFQTPTKDTISQVIDFLGNKEAMWGTPKEIIEHNKTQMLKVMAKLK